MGLQEQEGETLHEAGPLITWVLSYPTARAWICDDDLLGLAVGCT